MMKTRFIVPTRSEELDSEVSPPAADGASRRSVAHVVALGGGTGLPVVLRALRRHLPAACRITAVVAATDDGGSSGRLREAYGVLPPGDVRNCLLALAGVRSEIAAALQYRFAGADHPVGNLLLAALSKVTGDDLAAIRLAADLLGVEDAVLPATTRHAHLVADLVNGQSLRGESRITHSRCPIARVRLEPATSPPTAGILEAIRTADAVIIGPGSLYTSTLATLIVPGIIDAVRATAATRIYVCNLMTEPGETDGFGALAHLEALLLHGLPPSSLHYVVVNTAPIPSEISARYAAAGARAVVTDLPASFPSAVLVGADILDSGQNIRHAAGKLGPLLRALAVRQRPAAGQATQWS